MAPYMVILLLAMTLSVLAAELHVAVNGDDASPGTADRPFASLERARDAIRELKADGELPEPVTVWVHGGVYPREATFALSAEDSGSAETPIVYRAVEGETVRIIGGVAIPPEAIREVTDAEILDRMDERARGKVVQVSLTELGAKGADKQWPVTFRGYAGWPELFFDGQPLEIARWPNEGFARMAKVLDQGSRPRWSEKPDRPGSFQYEGDRPERWLKADEVYLNGYWCFKWYNEVIRVAKIDPENKSITFAAPHVYGIGGASGGDFFALNLLEELDRPGEYYLDRKAGLLYFWPPAPVEGKEIGLSIMDTPLVTMADVSNVTLRGFVFEFSCGQAVTISGGANNLVAGCIIRNLATDAGRIDGGSNNGVQSCDLYNLGGAGFSLSGGDRPTLTPCGNFAENNHIHHFGRLFRTHRDAVALNGVGCKARHNLIHDAPHHAIDFGGNYHLVEFNDIHDVCTETDDAGAIYTGRDWTTYGNMIRYNFWHNVGGSLHVGNQAIYLDDTACGVTSYGNVIYRVFRAFLIGGGRDNVADNNIIVDCNIPMHIDNRGLSWAGPSSENGATLMSRLNAVPYTEGIWAARFPTLANILEDEPGMPKRNRVTRNVMVRCGAMNIAAEARQHGTIENNLQVDHDPGFVDEDRMNFALKPDSEVLQQVPEFEPIPFDKIGLYLDEYRTVLPVRAPVIQPQGQAFVGETQVQILSPDENPVIRYTLDGSLPGAGSPVYTGPIQLTASATITAVAYPANGSEQGRSGVVRETFTVQHLGPEAGVYVSDLPGRDILAHAGLKRDVNYAGKGPITLAGKEFEKAIMLCPETAEGGNRGHVTYDLTGGLAKATTFRAMIGIDAAMGSRGSATFKVEVFRNGNWETVFESGVLKGGQQETVEADITGATMLRLSTTDAGDDIHADHAVFAGAVLQ